MHVAVVPGEYGRIRYRVYLNYPYPGEPAPSTYIIYNNARNPVEKVTSANGDIIAIGRSIIFNGFADSNK